MYLNYNFDGHKFEFEVNSIVEDLEDYFDTYIPNELLKYIDVNAIEDEDDFVNFQTQNHEEEARLAFNDLKNDELEECIDEVNDDILNAQIELGRKLNDDEVKKIVEDWVKLYKYISVDEVIANI